MDEKKPDRRPNADRRRPFNRKRRNENEFSRRDDRDFERRDYRYFDRRNEQDSNRNEIGFDQKSHGPRNIRFGTKFCGVCRACKFWIEPRIGKYRCDNSYLPFEIVEIRRDKFTNSVTEIVINLLV